jgi:hypothetical protein
MSPEAALVTLRRVKAWIHPPDVDGDDIPKAVDVLIEHVRLQGNVVEQARKQVCKMYSTCPWGLCRAVAELDGKRPPS